MRLDVKFVFYSVSVLSSVVLFCTVVVHVDPDLPYLRGIANYRPTYNSGAVFRTISECFTLDKRSGNQRGTERVVNWHGQRSIPKIIHQIWNDEIVPGEFVENVRSLIRDNPPPEWKYYFWTKESGLKFIQDKYPYLLEKAKDGSNILRADLLRYLVVYEYGGVYFDLDTVSVKSLDNFVGNHTCSFALEPSEHYFAAKNRDFLLSNAALLCIRKHQFYTNLVLHLNAILKKSCRSAFSCTGPPMLSWLYRELNKTEKYSGELPDIQPSEVFQDVYDHRLQRKRLESNCANTTKLLPYKKEICSNWIARGKEMRNLSELAITYHTWFHVHRPEKLILKESNHVKKLFPHSMIYGGDDLLRADLLRYLIVYEYGGVYFDLDTVSVKSLDHFVNTHTCSLAMEPAEHFFSNKKIDFLLNNGALLCARKHQFYTNIVLHLNAILSKSCEQAFLCTGPHMLTWLYRELNVTEKYTGELPDVQSSEVFQDVYDHKIQGQVISKKCHGDAELTPFQKQVCNNWIARHKENRTLSERALTYHTWFHVYLHGNLTITATNHIKRIVPHVSIYGQDFGQ